MGYDCLLGFLFMDCFGINSSCGCLWASGSFGFILVVGALSLVCFEWVVGLVYCCVWVSMVRLIVCMASLVV